MSPQESTTPHSHSHHDEDNSDGVYHQPHQSAGVTSRTAGTKSYHSQPWPQSHPQPHTNAPPHTHSGLVANDGYPSYAPPQDYDAQYHSDPRSLSSDTTAMATMSPVSSQEESVALPAAAVLPASKPTVYPFHPRVEPVAVPEDYGHATFDAHHPSYSYNWQQEHGHRHREQEWGHVKTGVARQSMGVPSVTSHGTSPQRAPPGRNRVSMYTNSDDEDEDDDDDDAEDKEKHENAFVILLRLSFLAPLFSLVAALYTFFVLLFLVVATPLRLCVSSLFRPASSFSAQLHHLLLPLLRRHQRLISTPSPSESRRQRHPYHRSDASNDRSGSSTHSVAMLALIHLLSPILIIPILFAAWIAAFFWIFAMILGNPDGTERRDDGRAAVLGVRNWWRIWLAKAEREEPRDKRSNHQPEMRCVSSSNAATPQAAV